MRRPFLLSLLFTAGLMILGYSQAGRANGPAPLVLGALYNLSGSQAELDVPSSRLSRVTAS